MTILVYWCTICEPTRHQPLSTPSIATTTRWRWSWWPSHRQAAHDKRTTQDNITYNTINASCEHTIKQNNIEKTNHKLGTNERAVDINSTTPYTPLQRPPSYAQVEVQSEIINNEISSYCLNLHSVNSRWVGGWLGIHNTSVTTPHRSSLNS